MTQRAIKKEIKGFSLRVQIRIHKIGTTTGALDVVRRISIIKIKLVIARTTDESCTKKILK